MQINARANILIRTGWQPATEVALLNTVNPRYNDSICS